MLFTTSVYATNKSVGVYTDVTEDMPIYEAVEWASEKGITNGVGNGRFAPDAEITLEQVATMLCRMAHIETDRPVDMLWQQYWLQDLVGVMDNSVLCKTSYVLPILFAFRNIPYYDSFFYSGEYLSVNENYLAIANRLGLIETSEDAYVTRGEFVEMLYKLATNDYAKQVEDPKMFPIEYEGTQSLNLYYRMLLLVPEAIRSQFLEDGWVLKVDYDYLGDQTRLRSSGSVVGQTDHTHKIVYVSDEDSVLHEFGHYLDERLGWASEGQDFGDEIESAQYFLRTYAKSNVHEYFAEYFAYFLKAQSFDYMRGLMMEFTPNTYAYFDALAENGWF